MDEATKILYFQAFGHYMHHLWCTLGVGSDSTDAQSPLDCYPIAPQRFDGHTNVANFLLGMGYV